VSSKSKGTKNSENMKVPLYKQVEIKSSQAGGNDSDSEDLQDKDNKKRRGRKRERDDLYFSKAYNKIMEIKFKLKTAK
jgi:hypothetical protein